MRYDIVLVSHNSERWLFACIEALSRLDYDLQELNLILVDNASSPACRLALARLQKQYNCFGGFTVLESTRNLGFGGGCNYGARQGSAPFLFFLNPDTEICPDALRELDSVINADDGSAGAFELRQKPVETGCQHDPVTMESDWNSGACVVYPRAIFERAEGFDENIFLYCEDVDLSWRIRAYGYRLLYVPRACVFHFTRMDSVSREKAFREYCQTAYNKLLLHYKYGDRAARRQGRRDYLETLRHPVHFDYVRRVLLKNYLRHFLHVHPFLRWQRAHRELLPFVPVTYQEGFTAMRGLYTDQPLTIQPLISIVIRAYQHPAVLRETLKSLRHQIYRNFEIVIEEDGEETLRNMLEADFPDLPISYEAMGHHAGRSLTGNRAIARARGEYINFLDSDDFFYPEHLQLMVATVQNHPDADIVLNGYMIYHTDIVYRDPVYLSRRVAMSYHAPSALTLPELCESDPIPILSAMFRRELYEKMGGLREDIETNEDWAMWLRFFTLKPHVYSNPRATCAFVFPDAEKDKAGKLESYRVNHDKVYDDPALKFTLTAEELRDYSVPPEKQGLAKGIPPLAL